MLRPRGEHLERQRVGVRDTWKDGRVAEGARLESVYRVKPIVGSNPTLSATTWRDGRVAEGGGLLNRYTVLKTVSGVRIPLSPPLRTCPKTDLATSWEGWIIQCS